MSLESFQASTMFSNCKGVVLSSFTVHPSARGYSSDPMFKFIGKKELCSTPALSGCSFLSSPQEFQSSSSHSDLKITAHIHFFEMFPNHRWK